LGTLSGIHIRQYQILERLRFDHAFAIYDAFHTQSQEHAWCWFVLPDAAASETFAREFLEQMQALNMLEHPNLVPILEFGREGDLLFWITPVMAGEWLATRLSAPRTPKETAALAGEIAAGLEYLHEQGYVHGCLSADTVFLDASQQACLGFYGLYEIANAEIERRVPEGMVGFGLGQPGYLSPEQINWKKATIQSDLYALGAITFTLLSGSEPFNAATPTETAFKQMTSPLTWPKKLPRGISQAMIRFVHKCLARNPGERFQKAGEARRALERIAQGKGARIKVSRGQMAGAPKPGYLPALRLGLLLAILLVAGGAIAWRYGVLPGKLIALASRQGNQPAELTAVVNATPSPVLTEITPTPAAARSEHTPTLVEASPTPPAEAAAAASTAQPAATPSTPGDTGPVLFGTRTPGEALPIGLENVEQIEEAARLGYGKFIQVAWAPSETTLALASTAGVFVINFTGTVIFIDPGDEADSVAFSLEGDTLAIGLRHGDIQLWDWQARQKMNTIQGHKDRVSRLLYSPNRRFLVSASYDKYIKVWDVNSGRLVRDIPAHKLPVYDISITSDSRTLVSGGGDQMLKVWDMATGNKLDEFSYPGRVQAVSITESGTYAAAGGEAGLLYQWSLKNRQFRSNPIPMRSRIWNLYYVNEDELVAGLDDGKSRTVSANARTSMAEYYYKIPPISNEMWETYGSGFEFSSFTALSGSKQTASVNWDGSLVLNTATSVTIPTMFEDFTRLAFSPDSRYLLAGGKGNQVFLLRTVENQLIGQIGGSFILNGEPFSQNSEMVALAVPMSVGIRQQGDNEIRTNVARIFTSSNMAMMKTLSEIPKDGAMQFTHGDTLLVAANASTARLWDLQTGSEAYVRSANEQGCAVARSTNDREMILSIYTKIGLIREWDDQAKRICGLSSGFGQRPELFSADRKWLASINPYGALEMLDIHTGKVTWQRKPEHKVANLAFSPDSSLLVTGSSDGTLSFWNVTDGTTVRIINAHFGAVQVVAFSPDGRRVATGSDDGTVRIWEVSQGVGR
jgi:WD40 repeat protein